MIWQGLTNSAQSSVIGGCQSVFQLFVGSKLFVKLIEDIYKLHKDIYFLNCVPSWSVKIDLLYCWDTPRYQILFSLWQHKTALPTFKKWVLNKIVSKPHFIIRKREGRNLALWCHYKARQTLVVLVFWSHSSSVWSIWGSDC